jgi:CRP-like cAMP-binding protein
VGLFAGLPIPVLDRLIGHGVPLEFGGAGPHERNVVFRQNDPADAVYAIVGGVGRIRLGVPSASTKRLMVEVLQQGDVFGELGVLESLPRTADAYADGPVQLVRIAAATFLNVISETPMLGANLARLLAGRLRRTFTLFQDASFETVEVRLARQVLYLAERAGRRTARGVRLAGQLRQGDLADLLGTTTRSIIKVLNAWRGREWVAYDGEKALFVLLNEAALQRLISPDKEFHAVL